MGSRSSAKGVVMLSALLLTGGLAPALGAQRAGGSRSGSARGTKADFGFVEVRPGAHMFWCARSSACPPELLAERMHAAADHLMQLRERPLLARFYINPSNSCCRGRSAHLACAPGGEGCADRPALSAGVEWTRKRRRCAVAQDARAMHGLPPQQHPGRAAHHLASGRAWGLRHRLWQLHGAQMATRNDI